MKKIVVSAFIILITFSFSFAQGTIRGKVSDKNGETLIGVTIVLKSNRAFGVTTDFDGNYSIKISDSTVQTLIVSYVSYKTTEEIVHPVNGEIIIKDFVLESASQDLGIVEVVAKSTKAKDYYMENLKKNSSTTLDFVSSETMKKTGDPNVTAAVARVPGVSTNSGGFITVRGIGDRYVKTTINGSRIPTLDPFTNNIKLDIIPASLVDNIIISKTASPDLPGDWAGAYLSVETKDYPEQLAVNMETSFGYNNQSTFKDVLTSQRSSTDWLGYDNNLRDHNHDDFVPLIKEPNIYQQLVALGLGDYYKSLGITNESWIKSSSPTSEMYYKLGLVQLGLLAPAEFDDATAVENANNLYNNGPYKSQAYSIINADAAKSGQSLPNNWNTTYRKAPLNFTQSFSIGNQTKLFGKPLGIIAGFRYGSSTAYDPNASINRVTITNLNTEDKALTYQATEQASKETNGWSALVNMAYKLNPNNSISFLFMPNFTGVNSARYTIDAADDNDFKLNKSQFYEQRKQLIYQLKSEHYIPGPKLKIELNASYTNGKSTAPDFKNLAYTKAKNLESYGIDNGSNRAYRYLSENLFDSRISAELPIGNKPELPRKLKFGAAYQDNQRNSEQYLYTVLFGDTGATLGDGNIDNFFSHDKFGINSGLTNDGVPKSSVNMYYTRNDYPSDHTVGYSKIKAAFAMVDYSIIPILRFAGGLRIEHAQLFTDAFKYNQLGLDDDDKRRRYDGELLTVHIGNLNKISYLPSANIILKLKKDEAAPINLRINYSQTVARPSIRELTDVVVFDYELRANVWGRSTLKSVQINNYDMRLESYFKNGDNVSLSVFYKDFKNHIELVDAIGGYTWINVDKSWVKGIELEGKKTLTKRFELRANITFVDSRTSYENRPEVIENGERVFLPSTGTITRSMFGQAPYVINGIFGYKEDSLGLAVAISYNIQGPRLVIGSPFKQLEIYELPRHLLDIKITKSLGKHFSTSLTVRDLLNAPVRRTYNYNEGWIMNYDKYRFGTNFILGISYKL